MNNAGFWDSVRAIVTEGFTPEGLQKMDYYAELFINGRLVYKRFSPFEQHGCTAGGATHVIASLIAGAETDADRGATPDGSDFQREVQRGAKQAKWIELWARRVGCWTECIDRTLPRLLGEQIADFPETAFTVLGFGRTYDGEFNILVEQPFIEGVHVSDGEIKDYMHKMGFELRNPHNWTYATPGIYLSDMHDENVIRSASGTIFVVDCDIRINTPELRQGGVRTLTTDVEII